MGLGALLIPGGNDALLMIGFPMGHGGPRSPMCYSLRRLPHSSPNSVRWQDPGHDGGPCRTSPARPAPSTRLAGRSPTLLREVSLLVDELLMNQVKSLPYGWALCGRTGESSPLVQKDGVPSGTKPEGTGGIPKWETEQARRAT